MREWFKEINKYTKPETLILLIANKADRADRVVSMEEGQALAKELGISIIETSARTAENVESAFVRIAEQLIQKKSFVPPQPRIELKTVAIEKKVCC